MENRALPLLLILCLWQIEAQSQQPPSSNRHALGIRISSQDAVVNHSISYKYFLNSGTAIEGLLSVSDPLAVGALLEKHKPFGPSGLSWFWGAGAYIGFAGDRNLGAQGVLGLDFIAPSFPMNFSVDWKPELNFTKEFSFEPAAVGFSARFIF